MTGSAADTCEHISGTLKIVENMGSYDVGELMARPCGSEKDSRRMYRGCNCQLHAHANQGHASSSANKRQLAVIVSALPIIFAHAMLGGYKRTLRLRCT